MPTDDDYGRRERLLLHQHTATTQFGQCSTASSQSSSSSSSLSQSQPAQSLQSHLPPQPSASSLQQQQQHQHQQQQQQQQQQTTLLHASHPLHHNHVHHVHHGNVHQQQSSGGSSSPHPSSASPGPGDRERYLQHQDRVGLLDGEHAGSRYSGGGASRELHRYSQQHEKPDEPSPDGSYLQDRYLGLQGLQGYHQFGVPRSDRFAIYGEQHHFMASVVPKDEGHYASPGSGIVVADIFPSPPSPAPTNDRFIPPPPLSPTPSESFPCPTSQPKDAGSRFSLSERLLSPSPIHPGLNTDRFATRPLDKAQSQSSASPRHDRNSAYLERYLSSSPNPEGALQRYASSSESQSSAARRYSASSSPAACPAHQDLQRYSTSAGDRLGEILAQRYGAHQSRFEHPPSPSGARSVKNQSEKYKSSAAMQQQQQQQSGWSQASGPDQRTSRIERYHGSPGREKAYLSLPKPKERFPSTGRVVAVNTDRAYASAHTPVERYVPQPPPEILYPGYVDLYVTPSAHTPTDRYVPAADPGDPYMRRDLGFHHHYRLPPPPGYPYHHQSHYRGFRGFGYAAPPPASRLGGSPGSSSSTSSSNSNHRGEFYTSPLLRPKTRQGNNNEFNGAGQVGNSGGGCSAGGSGNSGRINQTSHQQCCEHSVSSVVQQGPVSSQRSASCCNNSRRSLNQCVSISSERNSGGNQNNNNNNSNNNSSNNTQHTSWQPSPGSGTTSTSTGSSSGVQDGGGSGGGGGLGLVMGGGTPQSISMYAVGSGGTGGVNGGGGDGLPPNIQQQQQQQQQHQQTVGGQQQQQQHQQQQQQSSVAVSVGNSSKMRSESPGNPASLSTTTSPPVPLAASLARSASAPTGPRPHHLNGPNYIGQSNDASAAAVAAAHNQRLRRTLSRTETIKNYIKRETATFFGVDEDSEAQEKQRWLERRRRMASRKYGALLPEHRPPDPDITRDVPDSSEIPEGVTLRRSWHQPVRRKDSVARMTLSGLSYMVTTMARHRPRERDETRPESRSFPPSTVPGSSASPEVTPSADDDEEEAFFERPPPPSPSPSPQTNQQHQTELANGTQNEAAAGGGGGGGGGTGTIREDSASVSGLTDLVDAPSSSALDRNLTEELVRFTTTNGEGLLSSEILSRRPRQTSRDHYTSRTSSWRRSRESGGHRVSGPSEEAVTLRRQANSGTRIAPNMIDRIFDNSNRRQYGMGLIGRLYGRSFRKSVAHKPDVKKQLDDIEDHRPFFTYWITTVQVMILVISLACYGFGPFGFELNHRSGLVLVTSLSLQQVDYQEPANFWFGPRAADLIHLGAKFAPCMRRDIKILKEIDVWRERERDTACCIRNDDSGCVQSSKQDCSNTISTWKKWGPGDSGPGGRISGSVCGLDPKFCDAPASIAPYEWPDDITKWPICRKTNPFNQRFSKGNTNQMFPVGRHMDKMAEHMVCEVIGHPCCIGIHGMCRITTKEYCDFVHGYFHEEASLCSQVECLHDVCGMIPFLHPEWPDQFYRLFTSIFLHAGIFHLIITIFVQYFFMRDLEKLTGSFRIAIIYFTGGLAGNLASAIFVPYRAEVGPAGAHFALLATLVVEVLNSWPMLKHPRRALSKLLLSLFVLLLLGALPWIDNYAHLFGFVFGFLAAYAVMPFISFGKYDRRRKILLIWVCLVLIVGLFAMLLALFYNVPVYECEVCKLFTCIPFTKDFCASQNINFKREEPV